MPCVTVWAVWAVEEAPPAGTAAVDWLRRTTGAGTAAAAALARLAWYAARWGIEGLHKVLKSGWRLEARQLTTGARLQRARALYSVIAGRRLYGTLLARALPEVPCSVVLEREEWAALYCTIHRVATPPPAPPPLRQAGRWIAQLGGVLGRKGDGAPGVTVLWRGWQRRTELTTMYPIMRPARRTNVLRKD